VNKCCAVHSTDLPSQPSTLLTCLPSCLPTCLPACLYYGSIVNAAGTDFELDVKYEMIKPIGHGAYGVVISAINHDDNSKVGPARVLRRGGKEI
jgi:hypothetical protein